MILSTVLLTLTLVSCQTGDAPGSESSARVLQVSNGFSVDPDTTSAEELARIAKALAAQNQNEEADTFYQLAVEKAPANAMILLDYGRLLRKMERMEEAVPVLERAVAGQPPLPDARASLAGALFALGDTERALTLARESVAADSMTIEGHMVLGQALIKMGEKEAGFDSMMQAADLGYKSGSFVPTFNLGLAYLEDGQYDFAVYHIGYVVGTFPNNPDVRIPLARTYLEMGDSITALAQLNAALNADPDHPAATALKAEIEAARR